MHLIKKLYDDSENKFNDREAQNFLKNLKLLTLPEEEASELIKPVSLREIEDTIKTLKNNKSPGTDGFPGEFYKSFTEEITPVLQKVFNKALTSGDPPKSWSEAIISVLHKEGKDPIFGEAYMPVSLLCNDLKILTSKKNAEIPY